MIIIAFSNKHQSKRKGHWHLSICVRIRREDFVPRKRTQINKINSFEFIFVFIYTFYNNNTNLSPPLRKKKCFPSVQPKHLRLLGVVCGIDCTRQIIFSTLLLSFLPVIQSQILASYFFLHSFIYWMENKSTKEFYTIVCLYLSLDTLPFCVFL